MSQPSLKRAAIRTLSRVVRRVVIGRVPGLFDTAYYLKHNGDVAASGIDPYLHYVWRGAAENRDPAEDFDTAFFRNQSGKTRLDPVRHYLRFGSAAGLDPHPGFSSTSYLIRYPDVTASGVNPLLHYRTNGRREGRVAQPSAAKTMNISALRSVPSRHLRSLPEEGRPFSMTLLRAFPAGDTFESVKRYCFLLKLTHDEIALLVNAFDTMPTSGHTAITLEVSADTDARGEAKPHDARPKLDTVLFAFEHCYVAAQGDSLRIRYAELRLWDLREQEARVAEIFPAGAVEFRI